MPQGPPCPLLMQGSAAPDVHVLPSFASMGDGSPLGMLTALLTVVSVSAMAFTCHFNLLPIVSAAGLPAASARTAWARNVLCIISLHAWGREARPREGGGEAPQTSVV